MRVGIICYASVGGSGVVATELAHALGNRGHEVHLISADLPFRWRWASPRVTFERVEGSDFELPAERVFLAMGFVGPERAGMLEELGVDLDARGNVARDGDYRTSREHVFVCGDMGRGQSLIVWAIAEGRSCAAAVDRALMGHTLLPSPITPDATPMR